MTIAISLKVNDGVILASDSASTLFDDTGAIIKVYDNATKIFNLRKGLPIGAITWGAGSIGPAATSTLTKDLRCRFSGEDPDYLDWTIDPKTYTIEAVAKKLRQFIYDEHYVPAFSALNVPVNAPLGFIVCGYSAAGAMAEDYEVLVDAQGACPDPKPVRDVANCGCAWRGQPEALIRLLLGHAGNLASVMQTDLGVQQAQAEAAIKTIEAKTQEFMFAAPMPIRDAIDVAAYFVDVTINYERFRVAKGARTVGGPIQIAAITKHEGFKWVSRKHYFNRRLNPGVQDATEVDG